MTRFGISPAKFWGVALPVAAVGFLLFKPVFVDNAPPGPEAEGAPAGLLILESALSSIAMGLGIAMLVFGGTFVKSLPAHLQAKGRIVQIALFWIMAPWLVHSGLHITMPEGDFGRLVAIEYGFHVTTYGAAIVATIMIAQILHSLVGDGPAEGAPA